MLGERLRTLLPERGLTVAEFAKMCDLPLETVRNIYYGKSIDPKLSTAVKMADALNLSVNCLMGKCQHTPQERVLLRNYRECGQHGKSIIELIARYEAGAVKGERNSITKHKIPCIIPHGSIQHGIIYDTCETVEIETTVPEAYIAIEMINNDLAPIYCKGDIILFEDRFPNHGECASFFRKDRAYIRRFLEENGTYRLQCLHKHSEDMVFKRMDEVEYIGTCIGAIRT